MVLFEIVLYCYEHTRHSCNGKQNFYFLFIILASSCSGSGFPDIFKLCCFFDNYFGILFQTLGCLIFSVIIYLMTGQPMEWNRFGMFTFISWLMVLISQSLGFIIGAWFSVTVSIKRNIWFKQIINPSVLSL